MSDDQKQWWQTLPAIVGGAATLLTAITGLLLALNQMGLFAPKHATPTIAPITPRPVLPTRKPPSPQSKVDGFVGYWRNENPNTRGLSKADIQTQSNRIDIHLWGKCHPTDCDWGTQSVPVSDADKGVLEIESVTSFNKSTQRIKLLPDKRLQVTTQTHFTDNSHRPDYESVDVLVR